MPAWLLSFLISLLLKFGLPRLLVWLSEKFPNLPLDKISAILKAYLESIGGAKKVSEEAKEDAKKKLKLCFGKQCREPRLP